jgi:hypothetical protein
MPISMVEGAASPLETTARMRLRFVDPVAP